MPVCATKVAGLSTSLMVSVPEVRDVGRRVGLGQVAVSDDSTAASLVPRMLIGDRGVGAVGAHHVEVVGVVVAGDELVVGRARGVGPGAGRIDREGAVAAGRAGLRHEGRRAVDVADGQRAGGGDVGRRVGLGQVPACRPTEPPRRWCRGC